jgi:hypothetical protein
VGTLKLASAKPLSTPREDTITGHEMLGPLSTVPLRSRSAAFQAECRGFETRLPLQFPFRAHDDTQPVVGEGLVGCGEAATTLSVGSLSAECRAPKQVSSSNHGQAQAVTGARDSVELFW